MIHPRHIAITLIVACIASAASAVANANGGVPVAKLTQTSPQGSADSETSRSKVHVEQSNAEQPRFSDTEPSSVAVEAPKPAKNPDLTSTITSGTRSSEPPLEAPRSEGLPDVALQTVVVQAALPNLTPYQPTGWSDKIVVATTSGSRTDATTIRSTDTVYVNFGVINNGGSATSARFYTALKVDGTTVWNMFSDPPLNSNFFTTGTDLSLDTLSAGTHTIAIVIDSTGAVAESNESDNTYSKTIVVATSALPNLTPYQPAGWSDKIVVATTSGLRTDATTIRSTDSVYVNFGLINSGGSATAARFYTTLQVDGTTVWNIFSDPPLSSNFFTSGTDLPVGTLSAGTHTIAIVIDSTGAVSESNESDNSYSKTITVASAELPNAPRVTSFAASPSTMAVGGSAVLSWTTINATSVSISGVPGTQPVNGSVLVFPTVNTTYTLRATGSGGTATSTTSVRVTTSQLGRRRAARPPTSPALESASALVRSSTGGTITLPSGNKVSIAASLLQSDASVVVSLLHAPLRQPPSGNVAAVGTPLCVAFSPATATPTSTFAPAASPTATGVEVVLDLSRYSPEEVTGAVPFSELMVPTLPPDSRDVFLGLLGSVDAIKRTATVNFSKGLVDSFEITRSGSTATVCAELANWSGRTKALSLPLKNPFANLPALLRFDGVTWAPAGPFELKDPGRTCVMVHGIFSSVEGAFPDDCMRRIQEKNGCDTVLGFNYNYSQSIDQTANELVNALKGRGLHNVVIEGHSLGGVVAMTAIPRLRLGGLTIDHFVTLGSPVSGTTVAFNAQNAATMLAYGLDHANGNFGFQPFSAFVNEIGIKDQLIPGNFLTTARNEFLSSTPPIPWTAAAGTQPEFGTTVALLMCGAVLCDGLVPVDSALAKDWPSSLSINRLPEFPLKHTGLECDERVMSAVGDKVNPFVQLAGIVGVAPDKLSFSMSVGGFAPSPQAFTVANSALQTNSRLTYSVAKSRAWLNVDGPLITLGPGEKAVFNAAIAASTVAGLNAGTYGDVITVADASGASSSKTVVVVLTITGQTSPPTVVSFTASPSTIAPGQSSTLSWTTSNATSVSISGVPGPQPPSGSVSVSPAVTTNYTLTATGPGGISSATTTLTVSSSSTFTLTVSTAGSGVGTVSANRAGPSYAAGTVVTLTAAPATGSTFTAWSGACSGTTTTCSVTMNANQSVTATFGLVSTPGGVTKIEFVGGVGGFGSFANGKITPAGLFGVSITCDWLGNAGSKATRTTTTLSSNFTCANADVASWPDSSLVISATVTGTTLTTSITY